MEWVKGCLVFGVLLQESRNPILHFSTLRGHKKAEHACAGPAFQEKSLVGAFCETLVEAVHAAFRIDQFGAARKERVAA